MNGDKPPWTKNTDKSGSYAANGNESNNLQQLLT